MKKLLLITVCASAWMGLFFIFYINLTNGERIDLTISNILSYFTIQSNILVAINTTYLLITNNEVSYSKLRTGILINITVTGIIYGLILAGTWDPKGLAFVANALLHYSTPLLFVLYWVFFITKQRLNIKFAFIWLLYPLVYFAYTLLRGPLVNFYPYPFVDASILTTAELLRNGVMMGIFFLIVGSVLIFINNRQSN